MRGDAPPRFHHPEDLGDRGRHSAIALLALAVVVLAGGAAADSGPVVGWGDSPPPPSLLDGTTGTASAIAADGHSCAIQAVTGAVVCWGDNLYGQATPPPSVDGTVGTASAIAAGGGHSCAIQASTGAVVCWGFDFFGAATPPPSVDGTMGTASAIAAGGNHSCAIQAGTGAAVCWGRNEDGEASPPSSVDGSVGTASAIAAGGSHSCAIQAGTGAVVCWGGASSWYIQQAPPCVNGTAGTGASAIASGGDHSCAIQAGTGAVVCWGNDEYGQATPPASVDGIRGWRDLSCGGFIFFAPARPASSVEATAGTGASAIAAGTYHSCAIQAGTSAVVCWGWDAAPPPSVDGTAGTASAIAAGSSHSLAIRRPICSDGLDNDGDGAADFPADPGCAGSASDLESPKCQDGLDNDRDGKIDFDGGASANGGLPLAAPDSQCTTAWKNKEAASGCGVGFELALLMPLLAAARAARRRKARKESVCMPRPPSSVAAPLEEPIMSTIQRPWDTPFPMRGGVAAMRRLLVLAALLVALPAGAVARGGTPPGSLCDVGRQSHCRSAGKSRLLIKNSANDAKDRLTWQWLKGAATTLTDLGVPTDTTVYALCLYAGESTAVIAGADIAPSAHLWNPAGQKGFAYRDPAGSSAGIRQVALKSGASGKSSVVARGKGTDLPDPLSGPLPLPVTVQLVQGSDDACFEAIYDGAAVKKNDAQGFDAHTRATSLYVSASGALDGTGSVANPYRRITDAVARARAERAKGGIRPEEAIQIRVAPGTYVGSFSSKALESHPEYEVLPIILDVPRVGLIGSTVLLRDDRGLPTTTKPETETILEPDLILSENQHLFLVTRTANGGVGDRVTVEGFALNGKYEEGDPTFAAAGVYLDRVSEFRVRSNWIHRTTQGVITRLASGAIEGNLMSDNKFLGSLVSGGSLVHPATVLVHANRSRDNLHGFGHNAGGYVSVTPDPGQNTIPLLELLQRVFDRNDPEDVPQIPDTLTVTVTGNDASDNIFSGIRLAGVFHDYDYFTADPAQPVTSTLSATLTGNTCERNGSYGVLIDASRIPRPAPGEFNLTLAASFQGNTLAGNASASALVTFTYWGASAGWIDQPFSLYRFANESTFQLTDSDGELAGFDYDHPLTDPISGAVLDNALTVNGVEAPHGTQITPP